MSGTVEGEGVEERGPTPLVPLLAAWHVVSSTAEMKELIVIDWLENIICPINC